MGGQQRAKQKRLFKCSLGAVAVAVADAEQVIELAHKLGGSSAMVQAGLGLGLAL